MADSMLSIQCCDVFVVSKMDNGYPVLYGSIGTYCRVLLLHATGTARTIYYRILQVQAVPGYRVPYLKHTVHLSIVLYRTGRKRYCTVDLVVTWYSTGTGTVLVQTTCTYRMVPISTYLVPVPYRYVGTGSSPRANIIIKYDTLL